jgi:hypothetical protein
MSRIAMLRKPQITAKSKPEFGKNRLTVSARL